MPTYRLSSPYERPPLRRRASGLALALAADLALLLMVLGMAGKMPPAVRTAARPLIVDLLPEPKSPAAQPKKAAAAKPRSETSPAVKPPPVVVPPTPAVPKSHQLPWIEMSSADLAASDISKLPKGGSGDGEDGDSKVVGTGPNGETLYAAEWAREPTDAELGGYLPRNAPEGFGLIACKTIAGDRVEDCFDIDQTPGSHLASAVREAAWQFRVRPPRKNGRELVGTWVEIRIDYERSGSN